MDGQVSGLGIVRPLLTLSFVSTWILPLHVVSSTLKRKSSSSVMDGLQRRTWGQQQNAKLSLHNKSINNKCILNAKLVALFLYSVDNRFSDFRHDAQAYNNVRCLHLP